MTKVLHYVSCMDRGGQETFIMNVYREIDRKKVQFDFLCSNPKPSDYDDEIRALGGHFLYLPSSVRGNKITKYQIANKVHIDYLKQFKDQYDVVHIHNYHAFSAFWDIKMFQKAGFKKIILHSHNTNAPHPVLHKIFRFNINHKKIICFACSKTASDWMYGKRNTQRGKIFIIHNGTEVQKFSYNQDYRNTIRKEIGVDDFFVIGHIGRYNYQKNHDFLIEILKAVIKRQPQTRLVLVGRGELETYILQSIKNAGLEEYVILLGVRNDVEKLMQAFDVFVLPSLFEGFPVVLVEAQASGVPCVVSDIITKEAELSDRIKFVSLKDNAGIWADEILRWKDTPRSANEDARIENYDIDMVAKQLQKLYEEIAAEK